MIAALELCSIPFCLFVPGILLVHVVRARVDVVSGLIFAVGLSALVNHQAVVILTALGLYGTSTARILAALGFAGLALLILRSTRRRSAQREESRLGTRRRWLSIGIAAVLFTAALLRFSALAWADMGAILNIWDDIVSWNRWALDFASGRLPRNSWEYPQLLPSLWSLVYQIGGSIEVQFFVKALMAWLPLFGLLTFVGMWREDERPAGVIAAVIAVQLLVRMDGWATAAYADVPTGTLALMGFYAGWLSSRRSGSQADRLAWIGAAIVAAAMLAKQSGSLFALAYPAFLWLISPHTPDRARCLRRAIALEACLALPWYVCRLWLIARGVEKSIVADTAIAIHGGRSILDRCLRSLELLHQWLGGGAFQWLPLDLPAVVQPPTYAVVIAGCAAAALTRTGRALLVFVVLPYLCAYVFFFGYDVRNALTITPFLAWTSGIGFDHLLRTGSHWLRRSARGAGNSITTAAERAPPTAFWLSALAVAGMVVLTMDVFRWAGSWPRDSFVREQQRIALWKLGQPEVNQGLAEYLREHPQTGFIATSYQLISVIPTLKEHYTFLPMDSVPEVRSLFAPGRWVDLILAVGGMVTPSVQLFLEQAEKDGLVSTVAAGNNWRLYMIAASGTTR